jgi:hypothetical protein
MVSTVIAYDPVAQEYYDPYTGDTVDNADGDALADSEIAAGMVVSGLTDNAIGAAAAAGTTTDPAAAATAARHIGTVIVTIPETNWLLWLLVAGGAYALTRKK